MTQLIADLLPGAPAFVILALWLGIAFFLGTIATFGYLIWLRLRSIRQRHTRQEVEDAWLPVFNAMQKGLPVALPGLNEDEYGHFLSIWLEKREFARDRMAVALDELTPRLHLETAVEKLLSVQAIKFLALSARKRAIAIRVARWIDTPRIRQLLFLIAEGDDYWFALQACETLLFLGDRDSTRLVVQLLFRYPEHDKHITTRLGRAGGERVLRVLDPYLDKMNHARLEDFIYLIEQSGDKSLLSILIRRLAHPGSEEETASLLRAISKIGGRDQRELVLPFLNSTHTFVRLQAASALARVGQPEDASLLLPLLSDPEWWVRYRSAQSYIKLQRDNVQDIEQLIAAQTDRFAHDILIHVNSERTWHLL